ncbi:MAG: hypothetical protein US50_C0047G0003 [Candidatus Nomurabacteria bacterium GW2011_GWB1_37_5]|uniref:Glycosyltransferase RgtA/B/C/D-like domain-containing protein n=1 Tax=Candidatus Nomurabacteria bacterium GW2011_GWB1_37_5 TaxID=1618742 RepID=A0A0G0K1E9_9BACT|nr:MAG: hypothetical protein US50_C0047G0003 [Candidatus Nomurabacteria bacterium GW2011_GWB1_37_5]
MTFIILSIIYGVLLSGITLFSWGFVDANMPLSTLPFLYNLVIRQRSLATTVYVVLQMLLFGWYIVLLVLTYRRRVSLKQLIILIGITMSILYFAFPGFSYDLFNYIATAKVTYYYRENPWLVMPIEIPNEPMLRFLHASNKVALYGPSWILLTAIPHFLGLNNLFITIFLFKALVFSFYAALIWQIWKISKSAFALAFLALNPLVTIETLVSGHNDVVMMFLALWAMILLQKRRVFWATLVLFASIFIKGATIALTPIFFWAVIRQQRKQKIVWDNVWFWASISMYVIFFFSSLREEIYAWYLIWPLTFVVLMPKWSILHAITLGFSFGLPLRLAPFLYFRNWGRITPFIKKFVTFIPPALAGFVYAIHKKR